MDVVLKLREIRRMRNLTQKEVAEIAGVGEKTVSSFETGDRITSMKLSQLLQLLSAYEMTPAEFFGGAVEEHVFSELERLDAVEVKFVSGFRSLPERARTALAERFLLMIEAAAVAAEPLRVSR